MRAVDTRVFRIASLVCILLLAGAGVARAQLERIGNVAADTLARPSAEERLMAKVDSLRRAITEAPDRRRRDIARRIAAADSLCLMYDFPAAVDILGSAAAEADSSMSRSIETALLRAQAGMKMMSRVSQVQVIAVKRISLDDLYGMFPETIRTDETRFHIAGKDSRSLYFSAKDRTGAGGFDLYVSRRNPVTGQWSESVNMGFPYSSPYNDYLYADAGDGKHSVLVSDRDCPADSVNVYVLAYDPVPPRLAVGDARRLRAIAGLEPAAGRRAPASARRERTGVDMSAYTARTAAVRVLRDSVSTASRELEALRAGLEDVEESGRESYQAGIAAKELEVSRLRNRFDAANKELQELEQLFLSGNLSPAASLMQLPSAPAADSTAAELFLAEMDGRSLMMVSEIGADKPDIVLPLGTFGDYVEFPQTPAIRVRAVIPEEETLPPLAMTVIRLHTGTAPETVENEDSTVYISAPVNSHARAESLMMALRATGVSDISLLED